MTDLGGHVSQNENKCVLVVEDVDINYTLISILLNQLNVNCIWASNGEHAVQLCKNIPDIALVLMDIRMPKMDGYKAAQLIKKMNKNLPVIAQTAYVSEEDKIKCMEAGFNDYLTKPIYLEKLQEILTKYLK